MKICEAGAALERHTLCQCLSIIVAAETVFGWFVAPNARMVQRSVEVMLIPSDIRYLTSFDRQAL